MGQNGNERNSQWDRGGTSSLKQLAAAVLARNISWDKRGTRAAIPVPKSLPLVPPVRAAAPPGAQAVPSVLVPWHAGVAHMQVMDPPPGFSVKRWTRTCLDAAGLLDTHGTELRALGWTATDIFGLHATAPGPAVGCYGLAMLLDGGTITELTAERARFIRPGGAVLQMRRGTGRAAVPAWELPV